MPFNIHDLTDLSHWQGRTLWHYRAGRVTTLDEVCAAGYLDASCTLVRVGDTIWITALDGSCTTTVTEVGKDFSHVLVRVLGVLLRGRQFVRA
jgi:hypothetical protein